MYMIEIIDKTLTFLFNPSISIVMYIEVNKLYKKMKELFFCLTLHSIYTVMYIEVNKLYRKMKKI